MIRQISFCIINNGQDGKLLNSCIQSIHSQKIPYYEIIVFGAAGYEEGVQYLKNEDCGKPATVNAKRNLLCEKSSGEFIAFIDPNLELDGEWFQKIKDADNCLDIIGSKLTNPDNVRAVDWGYELKVGDKSFVCPLNYDEWTNKAFVSGALMLFRRQVWDKIKFDENALSTEIDFCLSAAAAGYRIGVFPEATAKYHTASLTFEESLRQINKYKAAFSDGMAAFRNNEYEKAIKAFKLALDTAPNDSSACGRAGWAYYSLGKYDDSIKSFDNALIHDPRNNYALRGRGWARIQKGDYANAIPDFSVAVECIKPNDKDALYESFRGLCWTYYFKGEFNEAIESFTLFLGKLNNGEKGVLQDVYRGLGWSNLRAGKFEASVENFKLALLNIEGNEDIKKEAQKGLDEAQGHLRTAEKQAEPEKKEMTAPISRHKEQKQSKTAKKKITPVNNGPSPSSVYPQMVALKLTPALTFTARVKRKIKHLLSKYI